VEKTITGKVIDGQTLSPLPFANIILMDSDIGTTTDLNGTFVLNNSFNADFMVVSYVGYKSLTVELDKINYQGNIVLSLLPINIFLQEVTVYSNTLRPIDEITSLSMQSERVREISAGMPDILRSVQSLPGISVNNEFKADFNVRGGNQDENLVSVNGARVYEPFHIKEAANASVGIFNVDLLRRVDLITGGFSARYGDKMSSVLNIQYREGSTDNYSGAASVSLAYLDGYIEGPITDDITFIIGARKSYLEYLLSMIDLADVTTLKPAFYDVQGVIGFNLSPTSKLLFEFIHSGDDFTYFPSKKRNSESLGSINNQNALITYTYNENEDYNASYFSNLFDIQSINILSSKAILKGEISYYMQTDNEYRLFTSSSSNNYKIVQDTLNYFEKYFSDRLTYDTLKITTLELRTDLSYQLTPEYEINTGLSCQNIVYKEFTEDKYTYIQRNNFNDPNIVEGDTIVSKGDFGNEIPIDAKSYKMNAFLENIFQVEDNLTLNLGGRLDYFDLNKEFTFSPRISAAYALNPNTTLRAAWGYYYQSPIYRQLKSSIASDTNTQSQLAIHYVLGLEHSIFLSNDLSNFLKLKIEGYYKDYSNLISSRFGVFERLTYSGYNDAKGNAKGGDIYAVLSIPSLYCWLSYGLLFANEDKFNDNIGEYPRYTDQRHSLSFVSSFDLGAGWNFDLRAFYGSGFPYTPRTAVKNNERWEWKSEKTHSSYLPAYRRIDVRLGKDFTFSGSTLNFFIDVSNVFNFKNIQNYEYKTPGFTKPEPEEVLLWPILPSFGIRYKF
jgi:outer membrane receptor for ferrienterochelin and colicin